ncbi:hypothetical protein BHE18_07720 [Rossellomorea aquimaris]|uniref:Uncharacterized protein n=1 Tax=Rossellomorea aquimaris TaxID=189382 RepID=A0A1J6W737_9BACI|nr:hypothetical protein BHE18_07720 [Rossellomorea aquimaris]
MLINYFSIVKQEKPMLFPTSVFLYEQRGWEKFFTVKQRGYMFACDQLHTDNISCMNLYWQVVCMVFHNIVKIHE